MGGFTKKVTKKVVLGGAKLVGKVFGKVMKAAIPTPELKNPAQAPINVEQTAADLRLAETAGLKKRRKGVAGLRVDLNTGGSSSSGLNLPRG